MSDTNETIADIIAEMRFHAQQNIDAEKDKPEYGFLTVEGRSTQSYADRLEAAHKREVGNRAALREAHWVGIKNEVKHGGIKMNEEKIRKILSGEVDIEKMDRDDFVEMLKYLSRMYFSRVISCVDGTGESDNEWTALSCIFSRVVEVITEKPVGNVAKLFKTADSRFDICRNIEQVLKIGRDYQNKDGYRGAHYDTVKLLCDAIEYQQKQLETKTEVGDCAKLREALATIRKRLVATYESEACFMRYSPNKPLVDLIDAALAAPPRNCDRFGGDIDKLREACARERGLNPEEDFPDVFPDWLLALAQKGGVK